MKNASTSYMAFELNCGYHFQTSYKENLGLRSQSKVVDKLAIELKELIAVYRENLQHVQKLPKQYHNKYANPRSYVPGDKVLLNSNYNKTKRNRKLEAKFFQFFHVLYRMGK